LCKIHGFQKREISWKLFQPDWLFEVRMLMTFHIAVLYVMVLYIRRFYCISLEQTH